MNAKKVISLFAGLLWLGCTAPGAGGTVQGQDTALGSDQWTLADSHFHISNYVGQGGYLRDILQNDMGSTVGRSTVMAIPLQQKWDYFEHFAGDVFPPTYYLGPKSELYYYSYADAMVAHEYNRLTWRERARFDPMITAFNPMDLYAVAHIKRVLLTNPGVFTGIGEFTVHKELVSDKLAGNIVAFTAGTNVPLDVDADDKVTLYNPSLVKILNFTAESGLLAVVHNDIYDAEVAYDGTVVYKSTNDLSYVTALIDLCHASPNAKVIWAHTGLGRFVTPAADHLTRVASVLDACPNWSTDISWDLVQAYIMNPAAGQPAASDWIAFFNKYQDRVLFGSDNVFFRKTVSDGDGGVVWGRRQTQAEYLAVANGYANLWTTLGPTVARKIQRGNYETLYDAARKSVRQWEETHENDDVWQIPY